jgi:hypothetical protein
VSNPHFCPIQRKNILSAITDNNIYRLEKTIILKPLKPSEYRLSKLRAISDSCRSRTFNLYWSTILPQCSQISPPQHLQRALILLQIHHTTLVAPEISSFTTLFYFTFPFLPKLSSQLFEFRPILPL